MMQHEFEERIGAPVPADQWPVVQRVYTFAPDVPDVGGKDFLAAQWKEQGGFWGAVLHRLNAANEAAAKEGAAALCWEKPEWYGTEIVNGDCRIVETRPATVQAVYDRVRAHLESEGLIDEYFSIADRFEHPPETEHWPVPWRWIAVFPVTGDSEGHYIHVEAIYRPAPMATEHVHRLMFLGKTFKGMAHAREMCAAIQDALGV